MNLVRAVDLFCGGGGTSSGLVAACRALRPARRLELLAINHWPVAVEVRIATALCGKALNGGSHGG